MRTSRTLEHVKRTDESQQRTEIPSKPTKRMNNGRHQREQNPHPMDLTVHELLLDGQLASPAAAAPNFLVFRQMPSVPFTPGAPRAVQTPSPGERRSALQPARRHRSQLLRSSERVEIINP